MNKPLVILFLIKLNARKKTFLRLYFILHYPKSLSIYPYLFGIFYLFEIFKQLANFTFAMKMGLQINGRQTHAPVRITKCHISRKNRLSLHSIAQTKMKNIYKYSSRISFFVSSSFPFQLLSQIERKNVFKKNKVCIMRCTSFSLFC